MRALGQPQTLDCQLKSGGGSTAAYKTFLGIDDPPVARGLWEAQLQARCGDFARHALAFPGATSTTLIPHEETFGKHGPALFLYRRSSDLFVLLGLSDAPIELYATGNVYARATPASERELRAKILASKGHLLPADVLEMALQVTHGSYPLAVLTAHNLLKNVTVSGRETILLAENSPARFARRRTELLSKLEAQAALVAKLQSLRADPAASKDKMGPWYHIFAVLTAGALVTPTMAPSVMLAEHGAKLLRLFNGEGGFNSEKHEIDSCFAAAAQKLGKISRWGYGFGG